MPLIKDLEYEAGINWRARVNETGKLGSPTLDIPSPLHLHGNNQPWPWSRPIAQHPYKLPCSHHDTKYNSKATDFKINLLSTAMASEQTRTPCTVRVAAVQAEGCYFDLPAAVEKTCRFIEEAASKGCDLIAFPELWIPMYPGWIWDVHYYHSTVDDVPRN